MSFKNKDKITVYSKSATETSDDVWYVQINGKFGYAPKKFITEERIIVSSAKLIIVENVEAAAAAVPSVPSTATPDLSQNTNESSSPDVKSAEINASNSNEETVSNVSEVQNEENPERLKRSIDKSDEVNDTVETPKSEEVKIEDLNEYDSKNFDENVDSNDEDDEEEEDDDEGDEYDDGESASESEEESQEAREPVVEDPVVKKTAYVTTDSVTEKPVAISNDDVQPTLEIMAPTQAEIEQLTQQQVVKDASQEANDTTPSSLDSTANSESVTPSAITSTEPETIATTTIPIDIPQNPLNIPIETTTPLPNAIPSNQNVDQTSTSEQVKVDPIPTNSGSDNPVAIDDPVVQVDSVVNDSAATSNPKADEVPPFKPLPSSVNDVASDFNDSTTDVPNVSVDPNVAVNTDPSVSEESVTPWPVDNVVIESTTDVPNVVIEQEVVVSAQVNTEPSVNEESVQPIAVSIDLNDSDANTVPSEQRQIIKEDEPVTTAPVEIVDSSEVSNDSVPKQESVPVTENTVKPPSSQEAAQIVERVGSLNVSDAPSDTTNTSSDDKTIEENEIVPPPDVLPTVEYLTQKVNEGVGTVEPIIQSVPVQSEQQQPVENENSQSEPVENVENSEGIFSSLFSSVKNLFGGSSTVDTIVEDSSNENFDQALNDILFAVPASKDTSGEGK